MACYNNMFVLSILIKKAAIDDIYKVYDLLSAMFLEQASRRRIKTVYLMLLYRELVVCVLYLMLYSLDGDKRFRFPANSTQSWVGWRQVRMCRRELRRSCLLLRSQPLRPRYLHGHPNISFHFISISFITIIYYYYYYQRQLFSTKLLISSILVRYFKANWFAGLQKSERRH